MDSAAGPLLGLALLSYAVGIKHNAGCYENTSITAAVSCHHPISWHQLSVTACHVVPGTSCHFNPPKLQDAFE